MRLIQAPIVRNIAPLANAVANGARRMANGLFRPPPSTIAGVDSRNWPSALQPIQPMGPPGSQPLGMNFFYGQNLVYTPRPDAEYTAAQLKTLSQYPLARICIENVKDTICYLPWRIQLKPVAGEMHTDRAKRAMRDKNIGRLTGLFECPDGQQPWSQWLRPFLDAMLVTDSACFAVERGSRGGIPRLKVLLSSDSIARYIDDTGFTPEPPSPAYSQLWDGIPRIDCTTDQLFYVPRNIAPRNTMSSALYGFGSVEQIAKLIEIGVARLIFVYAYYRSGSIPDMLHIAPADVTAKEATEAMQWMNSELSGQLDTRRGYRVIQGFQRDGKQEQILFPKEPLLTDLFDDYLIHQISFGIGCSAQRLLKSMNRASAVAAQDAAEEEGTAPYVQWLQAQLNFFIQRKLGYDQYEISFDPQMELDGLKQMEIDTGYVKSGIYTINERRELRGDDPRAEPQADQLGALTPNGWLAIGAPPANSDDPKPTPQVAPPEPARSRKSSRVILVERGDPMPMFVPGTQVEKVWSIPSGKVFDAVPVDEDAPLMLRGLEKYSYGSTQVDIAPASDAGMKLAALRASIDKSHLMAKGLENTPHITVRYGFKGDTAAIRKHLRDMPPFNIAFGKVAAFDPTANSDDAAPLHVEVESSDLASINASIVAHGDWKKADFEYHPHATIAYVNPDNAASYVESMSTAMAGLTYNVTAITISPRDGDPERVELLGVPAALKTAKGDGTDPFTDRAPQPVTVSTPVISAEADPTSEASNDPADDASTKHLKLQLKQDVHKWLTGIKSGVITRISSVKKISRGKLRKDDQRDMILYAALDYEVFDLPSIVEETLYEAAHSGALRGLSQVQAVSSVNIGTQQQLAREFAQDRAAEMVGMKWVDGELVANPNAAWSIDATTREAIRKAVTDAFSAETKMTDLIQAIKDLDTFDEARAENIAATEVHNAQSAGNYAAWEQTGVVLATKWVCSSLGPCDECQANADAGPVEFGKAFPSGHVRPVAHPKCRCIQIATKFK
jgi:2'-5' RNA ligase